MTSRYQMGIAGLAWEEGGFSRSWFHQDHFLARKWIWKTKSSLFLPPPPPGSPPQTPGGAGGPQPPLQVLFGIYQRAWTWWFSPKSRNISANYGGTEGPRHGHGFGGKMGFSPGLETHPGAPRSGLTPQNLSQALGLAKPSRHLGIIAVIGQECASL